MSKDKFFLTRWTAADEDTAEGTDGGLVMVEYLGEGYVTRD